MLITEPAFLERPRAICATGATALDTVVCVEDLLEDTNEGAGLHTLAADLQPDDLLTIIYTSGHDGASEQPAKRDVACAPQPRSE